MLLALCFAALQSQDGSEWRYVVPPAGAALRSPQPCAIPLSAEAPADVRMNVEFRGKWQRYGMLRYGDPDSTRVALVLDHHSATEVELFVDAARDLAIDPEDRVQGDGRTFELSLSVATHDEKGLALLVPRRVVIELGQRGAILGAATLGWLEGQAEAGGKSLRVLRRDSDANGFFGDARDQLWLDRDGSGEFAPLEELYVVQPILSLDGKRYALRSDRLGKSMRFDLLEGAGRVQLVLPGPGGAPRTDVVDVQALLVGRDGSAVLARGPGAPTEVPIGEYRLGMVTLRIADPAKGDPWSYVFSETTSPDAATWRAVAKDSEITLDPMGELRFGIELSPSVDAVVAGDGLTLRPRLHTGDRLLINTAYRGREAPAFGYGSLQATFVLQDETGTLLTSGTSGFA